LAALNREAASFDASRRNNGMSVPDALVVIDTIREQNAVKKAAPRDPVVHVGTNADDIMITNCRNDMRFALSA